MYRSLPPSASGTAGASVGPSVLPGNMPVRPIAVSPASGAKAATANFTQWMSVHFNQNYSRTIRVNAIAPGFLLTSQNRYLLQQESGEPTERGRKVLDKTPMGRYGTPEEMAGAAIWLCSDAASFVNGAIIPIDGGFSAYWGV